MKMVDLQIGERRLALTGEGLIQQIIDARRFAGIVAVAESARDAGRKAVAELAACDGSGLIDLSAVYDLSQVQKDHLGQSWFDAEVSNLRALASAREYVHAVTSPERDTPNLSDYRDCLATVVSLVPQNKGAIALESEVFDESATFFTPRRYRYIRNDIAGRGTIRLTDDRYDFSRNILKIAAAGCIYLENPAPATFRDKLAPKYQRRYKVEVINPDTGEPQVDITIHQPQD